jgi:superfamily II DNA or RNA helicase
MIKAIEVKRGVICLPTGSGKTRTAIAIIARLRLPALFFVHKKELLYQTKDALEKEFKTKIGQVGDGETDNDLQPITVAMVQTASRLPQELFRDYGVAIFDECHHAPADTVYDIAKELHCEYVIGLSATPRREDGKETLIWAATGRICKNVSTSELIERKFLAKPYIDYIEVKAIPIGYHTKYQEVYKKAIVNNDERNGKIALKAVELAALGKTYIHVRQIAHGKTLVSLINDALPDGYPKAEFIYGQDSSKTRQRVINSFRRKDLRIMVSTLLGEGMDLPEMYALILASGGLSRTFVQQVFGRVLRGSVHKVVEFWDVRDVCTYLYDHFLERVRFYKSEPAFVLSPKLEKIEVPPEKEE